MATRARGKQSEAKTSDKKATSRAAHKEKPTHQHEHKVTPAPMQEADERNNIEPVGTAQALEPIITEDGVIDPVGKPARPNDGVPENDAGNIYPVD